MKAYLLIPLAGVIGLIAGSWGPRDELRALKEEMSQPQVQAKRTVAQAGLNGFTDLINIPREAKNPRNARKRTANVGVVARHGSSTNALKVAMSVTNAPAARQAATSAAPNPRKSLEQIDPEDLRARIDEARELWATRVDIARATWKEKLGVDGEAGAKFDAAMDEMNDKLYETMQALVDTVADKDKVSPEVALRLFGDASTVMAETYSKVGEIAPPERRDTVSQMMLTDFIDPGVAEPLIAVKDKFTGFQGAR